MSFFEFKNQIQNLHKKFDQKQTPFLNHFMDNLKTCFLGRFKDLQKYKGLGKKLAYEFEISGKHRTRKVSLLLGALFLLDSIRFSVQRAY